MLTKDDIWLLIELICDKQTKMILKNNDKYKSSKYRQMEELKIKLKKLNSK